MTTCKPCSRPYSQQLLPRVTFCGHAVCQQCITYIFQTRGKFVCTTLKPGPYCPNQYDYPTIQNFPVAHCLLSLIEYYEKKEREQRFRESNKGELQEMNFSLQQKCMLSYCVNKRFIWKGKKELFCSLKCKQIFQQQ